MENRIVLLQNVGEAGFCFIVYSFVCCEVVRTHFLNMKMLLCFVFWLMLSSPCLLMVCSFKNEL